MNNLEEIRVALSASRREVARYFGGLSPGELYRRPPGEWAPIDDLRHLNRSVAPLARALRLPKLVIRLRFGRAKHASRSYEELKATYYEGLEAGVKAAPGFVPPEREVEDREAYRTSTLERWVSLGAELNEALGGWNDATLDRYLLPHPALGPLTIREMLFFTHFHNLHHMVVAQRRVKESAVHYTR